MAWLASQATRIVQHGPRSPHRALCMGAAASRAHTMRPAAVTGSLRGAAAATPHPTAEHARRRPKGAAVGCHSERLVDFAACVHCSPGDTMDAGGHGAPQRRALRGIACGAAGHTTRTRPCPGVGGRGAKPVKNGIIASRTPTQFCAGLWSFFFPARACLRPPLVLPAAGYAGGPVRECSPATAREPLRTRLRAVRANV